MFTLTATPPLIPGASRLRELIVAVRRVVRTESDAGKVGASVAHLLQPCLGAEDFLRPEQMAPGGEAYRQHILHVEPDGSFSVAALVWLPGQATAIHDHVSWCVVGVHKGQENETVYRLEESERNTHLVMESETVSPIGSVAALVPPGDIHQVENGGSEIAVSLHVYGADIGKLGSSIRRRYDLGVRHAPEALVS